MKNSNKYKIDYKHYFTPQKKGVNKSDRIIEENNIYRDIIHEGNIMLLDLLKQVIKEQIDEKNRQNLILLEREKKIYKLKKIMNNINDNRTGN